MPFADDSTAQAFGILRVNHNILPGCEASVSVLEFDNAPVALPPIRGCGNLAVAIVIATTILLFYLLFQYRQGTGRQFRSVTDFEDELIIIIAVAVV